MKKRVLDVACGSRMFYFDKQNPNVEFCDIRHETNTVKDASQKTGVRTIEVNPDTVCDFRDLPFGTNSFNLVIFDPPHYTKVGSKSWLCKKYGKLNIDT
jgi:ubiquinone/menaquinone biosynthesis C-methylase UbiE